MMHQNLFEKSRVLSIPVRLGLALALLLALVGVAPLPAAHAATTLTINASTADDNNPAGGCTLREAIDLANAGAIPNSYPNGCTVKGSLGTPPVTYQINLSAYTYTLASTTNEDNNVDGDLDIEANVIIMGQGTAGATVIDGSGIDRVFHVDPGGSGSFTVQIFNTTIQNGSASSDGGGIQVPGSNDTLYLSNAIVYANASTRDGGGIYNAGTLTLTDSDVYSNTTGGYGGGIYNQEGIVTLNDSTISGNTSGYSGGGIYSRGETVANLLTLAGCTISDNTANSVGYVGGGGIYLYYNSAVLTNTTISGNTATATHGGGIGTLSDYLRTIDLVHCTIYSNTAGANGGGMFLEISFTVNVLNTIVAGNGAGGNGPDIHGTINSQDYNLIQDTSDATINGTTTHNVTGEDPQLGPLADNGGDTWTHALLGGSPAIDAVPAASCALPTDQRGEPRPVDGDLDGTADCDIGAYEFAPTHIYLPLVVRSYS